MAIRVTKPEPPIPIPEKVKEIVRSRSMLREPKHKTEVLPAPVIFADSGEVRYVPAIFGENCWGNRSVLCAALKNAPLYGEGASWPTPQEAMKTWETSKPTNQLNLSDQLACPINVLELDVIGKGLYRDGHAEDSVGQD